MTAVDAGPCMLGVRCLTGVTGFVFGTLTGVRVAISVDVDRPGPTSGRCLAVATWVRRAFTDVTTFADTAAARSCGTDFAAVDSTVVPAIALRFPRGAVGGVRPAVAAGLVVDCNGPRSSGDDDAATER